MINVVSVITELKLGGGENRILNFARAIDRSRFRHTLTTVFAPNPREASRCGSLRAAFDDAGIDVIDLQVPHPGAADFEGPAKAAATAKTLAAGAARLRRLFVSSRAHVVDAHLEGTILTAVPAAASIGVPVALTLYSELDLWKMQERSFVRGALLAPLRRFNLRLASALVTDSAVRAADFRSYLGPRAPPVHVIPNGVRLDAPARPRSEILAYFGIPLDTRSTILGQVAGLVPYKGQHFLVQAARRLLDAGHDVRALLVGDERMGAAYPAKVRDEAARLGIADRVHMRAYAGNIGDAWSIIDIHVHASLVDSFPNAVIEGMSLGKPAVLSAVGAVPDHVDSGRTGIVVPPCDGDALAAALLQVVGDPALAKRLGDGARARYLERFTPEVTARQMESCLEGLVRARGARGELR